VALKAIAAIGAIAVTCAAFRTPEPFRPPGSLGPVGYSAAPHAFIAQYHAAEKCTGKTGDVTRVKWQIVQGQFFNSPAGEQVIGYWDDKTRTISIASAWVNHPWVIRHESIHDLLGPGHPSTPFEFPCHARFGFLLDPDPYAGDTT
jgi:hypothetical protein